MGCARLLVSVLVLPCLALSGCGPGLTGASEPGELYNTAGLDGTALFDAGGLAPAVAAAPFVRLGLMWDAPSRTVLECRLADGSGRWSGWLPVEARWTLGMAHNGYLDAPDGVATGMQLRLAAGPAPSYLMAEAIEEIGEGSPPESSGHLAGAEGLATTAQALGPSWLVHPKSDWGGRAPVCSSTHSPYRITIHHTATPLPDSLSPAARMRQMQDYHMDARGFCDIGYHFVVDWNGEIWQGRDESLLGAHTANNNSGNVGISFMGTYQSTAATATQITQSATLVGWLCDTFGIPRDRSRIKGHREYGGTTCPGDALFGQIDAIAGGGSAAPVPLAAGFAGQGSSAAGDPDGLAYYRVCTGQQVEYWFELENTGATSWVDWAGEEGTPGLWGHSVRLGRRAESADPIAGIRRISVNQTANPDVHPPNWNGGDCNDAPFCRRVVFAASGAAPSSPGIYRTDWQLVDEGRTWFGPEMWLSFNVVAPCQGRQCGRDPICGLSCGTCQATYNCDESGQCVPPAALVAELVSQGSDAEPDPAGLAQYSVCAGDRFHFWFELRNLGSASWVDWPGDESDPAKLGHNVRLGRRAETPDPITGTRRISLNENVNNNVHPPSSAWPGAGGDCSDLCCQRTVFSKGAGILAAAPAVPGIYRSEWQLVDEGRAWFGPEVWLSFRVVLPECGDRVCGPDPRCGASCGSCPAGSR
ncbi:MAG: N-acetylmuramoyl-L-alanine amidase, partial [Deltaproteobacteria bacterium]|nr:N-acetylmuramoyl-L-alanine amidase [Deltaproteobacteria bacterium]